MDRIIAVDTGKYMTKAALRRADGTDKLLEFRTKMDEAEVALGQAGADGVHFVEYDGKSYVIGKSANSADLKETTKAALIHRIAAYTAIALLTDNGDQVQVVIGCPISEYMFKEKMIAYRSFMFPVLGKVEIKVDGTPHFFNVKKVQVLPEGMGVVFLHPEKYGRDIFGLVDVGGLNCNCVMFQDNLPLIDSMFTNGLGGGSLYREVGKRLGSILDGNLRVDVLEKDILRGYDIADREKSQKIISECRRDQVKKILAACQEAGWPVRSIPMTFTGGTSLLLKQEIADIVPNVVADDITEDIRYINVKGFLAAMAGREKR